MTRYYILDSTNNTWSRRHYPLHAILSRPGVTDEHMLADAQSGQTLTVAQARACKKLRLTPPNQSLLRSCVPGYESTTKAGSKGTMQPIPMKIAANPHSGRSKKSEYKVLSQNAPCFGGRFDAETLEHVLNELAGEGWQVLSCQTAAIASEYGELKKELLVLLCR